MSRPAARKAAPKGEYIETVSDSCSLPTCIPNVLPQFDLIYTTFYSTTRYLVPQQVPNTGGLQCIFLSLPIPNLAQPSQSYLQAWVSQPKTSLTDALIGLRQ